MASSGLSCARIMVHLVAVSFVIINNGRNILPVTEAMWLTIPSTERKCVSEHIPNNNVVLAEYYIINLHYSPKISVQVTSPYGDILHNNENMTRGQFAFTAKEDGNHVACFWVGSNEHQIEKVRLVLNWTVGINTKDLDSIIKKEHIESIEVHLLALEGLVGSIHDNLIHLKQREADIRAESESMNVRIAWLSIMSIAICIIVSILQTWRLKRYFVKKKIL